MWYETDRNEFVLAQLLCLEADQPSPRIVKCHEMGGNQEWKHKGEVSLLNFFKFLKITVYKFYFLETFTNLQHGSWDVSRSKK